MGKPNNKTRISNEPSSSVSFQSSVRFNDEDDGDEGSDKSKSDISLCLANTYFTI